MSVEIIFVSYYREGQNFLSVVQKKLNERRAKSKMKEQHVDSRVRGHIIPRTF